MKSMVNLHNSCNEGVDASDDLLLSLGYAQGPWLLRDHSRALRAAPELARDPLQQSLYCGPHYDDAKLENMLHQVHRAQAYHSLREDLSVSLSPSAMSDRTGQPVGDRSGQPVSTEAQKHRLGLYSMIKKGKFLQNAKQEIVSTNFKQLEPKKSNDSFKGNYCSQSWNFVKLIKEVSLKWKN